MKHNIIGQEAVKSIEQNSNPTPSLIKRIVMAFRKLFAKKIVAKKMSVQDVMDRTGLPESEILPYSKNGFVNIGYFELT